MRALEALTRVIAHAEAELNLNSTRGTDAVDQSESEKELEEAVELCKAILETALPLARYRVHVEFRPTFGDKGPYEYTLCAVRLNDVVKALSNLRMAEIRVNVWEHKTSSASLIFGFQGMVGSKPFKLFLSHLTDLELSELV